MSSVLEDLVRQIKEARNRFDNERSKLDNLQSHLGEFVLLNKDVPGIDLSAFHEQADEIKSEMEFYRGQVIELKAKLMRAVELITV